MVSLKTIAERCGVSTATVSKALNDHKDISEETKNRVKQTAEALGYFPNAAARALKTTAHIISGYSSRRKPEGA